ncbi:hypothetical protein [uncultured Ligilactobacillus sp.]|uniref:hypothetical protein n=1 Tax=uncultured Ligilactobacillus sp. TaxID=2837633 RepID=UPI00272BD631|nr:hypothetical protein [uncultured Ligilactobacillus sp.]
MNNWYDFLMEYKWRFISGGILAVILAIVGVFGFEHSAANTAEVFAPSSSSHQVIRSVKQKKTVGYVYVDVKGEVNHPGLYKLSASDHVRRCDR